MHKSEDQILNEFEIMINEVTVENVMIDEFEKMIDLEQDKKVNSILSKFENLLNNKG